MYMYIIWAKDQTDLQLLYIFGVYYDLWKYVQYIY